METQQIQARQVAYIINLKDLSNGTFVKEEGWSPNYVSISDKKVSRVNFIAAIINVEQENNVQNMLVDDGTGKISLRNFEAPFNVTVGDIVLIIGRVRQFGNEIYITPEIIKKNIDTKWSAVWKELALKQDVQVVPKIEEKVEEISITEEPKSNVNSILEKIKELDDGSGANYEEILKTTDEKTISSLLQQGEIFELKPGKLKVLD